MHGHEYWLPKSSILLQTHLSHHSCHFLKLFSFISLVVLWQLPGCPKVTQNIYLSCSFWLWRRAELHTEPDPVNKVDDDTPLCRLEPAFPLDDIQQQHCLYFWSLFIKKLRKQVFPSCFRVSKKDGLSLSVDREGAFGGKLMAMRLFTVIKVNIHSIS